MVVDGDKYNSNGSPRSELALLPRGENASEVRDENQYANRQRLFETIFINFSISRATSHRTDFQKYSHRVVSLHKEEMCLAIVKDTFRPVVAHELLRNVTEDDKIAVIGIHCRRFY